MGGSPEMSCALCKKSLDLSTDLSADENGRGVHERCYINRIMRESWTNFLASSGSSQVSRPPRGSPYRNRTLRFDS